LQSGSGRRGASRDKYRVGDRVCAASQQDGPATTDTACQGVLRRAGLTPGDAPCGGDFLSMGALQDAPAGQQATPYLTTDKAFMAERRANSDRPRRSFGLGAHFASHQLLHRVAHRLALVHHAMDFPAYRHVDGQARGNGTDRTRREYAFNDLLDPALRLL
jgi:hypothetical protein